MQVKLPDDDDEKLEVVGTAMFGKSYRRHLADAIYRALSFTDRTAPISPLQRDLIKAFREHMGDELAGL
jgi:hypothetical protein